MSQEPFLIILGTFGKNQNFPKKFDFVRVTFQFLARGGAARSLFSDMTTDLGSSSKDPPGPRAVLAGVDKNLFIFPLETLNAITAVGLSLFRIWPPGRKCFAPS